MKKILKHTLLFILIAFLVVWLGSLIKCEVLTKLHYDEFKDAYKQCTMINGIDYFKVLKYERGKTAEVYYIEKDNMSGSILHFRYVPGEKDWKFTVWETLWTNWGGNADNVTWPYWWHYLPR